MHLGSRLEVQRRLLFSRNNVGLLRGCARGHAGFRSGRALVYASKNPFEPAVAAFAALPREQLQGAVLVCDGTYLATAVRWERLHPQKADTQHCELPMRARCPWSEPL